MSQENQLESSGFARSFGVAEASLPKAVRQKIEAGDFAYRRLSQAERDAVVLRILTRLHQGDVTLVGEHRHDVWEKGWEENLDEFSSRGFALESLLPRFVRDEHVIRLEGDFAYARNPRFEFFFHDVARRWLYTEFMAGCEAIYEFGCGSAYNLVAIAELAPHVRLVGLDWADSAVRLAQLIGEKHGIALTGRRFDLFHPDSALDIGGQDAALTICALEQVGDRHEAFVNFLLAKKPRVCVHMEPLLELYDPANLPDFLASRFHAARKYLSGFLPFLQQLQAARKIEILKVQRLRFGSLFHEGYSVVAWRPL